MENSGCFPQEKPAVTVMLPNRVFLCFYNPPNSDMDYRIFNMHTDVNACDFTRGVRTHVRVCTERWLWEKNPLPHRGIEPATAARRSDAPPMSYVRRWVNFPPWWFRNLYRRTICNNSYMRYALKNVSAIKTFRNVNTVKHLVIFLPYGIL